MITDWRTKAACAGENPELWFRLAPEDRQLAATICGRCPVQRECGEFAVSMVVDTPPAHRYGKWGSVDFDAGRVRQLESRKRAAA